MFFLSMRYDLILAKCVGTVLALENTVHLSYIIILWFSNLDDSRRVNDWELFFEEVEIEGLLRLLLLKSFQDLKTSGPNQNAVLWPILEETEDVLHFKNFDLPQSSFEPVLIEYEFPVENLSYHFPEQIPKTEIKFSHNLAKLTFKNPNLMSQNNQARVTSN